MASNTKNIRYNAKNNTNLFITIVFYFKQCIKYDEN